MVKVTMKVAWMDGQQAAIDGKTMAANPFSPEKALWESWNDGWLMGWDYGHDQMGRIVAKEVEGRVMLG